MQNYAEWFAEITKKIPFPYQERLATETELPILLNVPTGAGKTAAAVLSWLWRRRYADVATCQRTPRRLVYCLPMRTLVEQTHTEVEAWLEKAGLSDEIGLHLLMGGAVSNDWEAHPEKDCILIGTQDQLLSRALNRGYGMSRYKWPIHFALLNSDCLWVMDEVQLMGAGLRTTAQLQGFRELFGTCGTTRSLWMSATLDSDLLQTVNYKPDLSQAHQLTDADLLNDTLNLRMQSQKRLVKAKMECIGKESDYAQELAKEVIAAHKPGSLTLVICNRVTRAQKLYEALAKQSNEELTLIHSRFRAAERKVLNRKLREGISGILVATQAIEAGVDISAQTLFTELAPWSSMVQRFGRCNRYGECSDTAAIHWVDSPDLKKDASPYTAEQLEAARSLLKDLSDVGPSALEDVEAPKEEIEGLIPRQHDLLQLFDTSTDLAGHDIDISSFIRETDETDVAIAWRDWAEPKLPDDMGAIQQQELCRVSIGRARDFFSKLKNHKAWVRDGWRGWKEAATLSPGMTLLLHCSAGGYDPKLGFTGDTPQTPAVELDHWIAPDQDERDGLSGGATEFVRLTVHSQDVAEEVATLCEQFPDLELPIDLLIRAGRWHDAGKAHHVFQTALTHNRPEQVGETLWAKSNHDFKNPDDRYRMPPDRRGFRHELVSALLALQEQEDFLLCYLVACHHGKVRMTIQPRPMEKPTKPTGTERFALGVHHGDRVHNQLPEIDLGGELRIKSQEISLDCMGLGDGEHGESWTAQAIALLEEYGPFKLAFLETLIRIADWRGSKRHAPNVLEGTE